MNWITMHGKRNETTQNMSHIGYLLIKPSNHAEMKLHHEKAFLFEGLQARQQARQSGGPVLQYRTSVTRSQDT